MKNNLLETNLLILLPSICAFDSQTHSWESSSFPHEPDELSRVKIGSTNFS